MTTREKGTGLGLAIVRKILEDHGGQIELLDSPMTNEGGTGAMVRVTLPVKEQDALQDSQMDEGQPSDEKSKEKATQGAGS